MRYARVCGAAVVLVACGGATARRANVAVEPMPEGGSFTGVYFSPQYGEMNVVQTGATVLGEYRKDERHGRIQGTAQGNVMRFEWTERRELIAGRPVTNRGGGYFRYLADSNGDHVLVGEWGHDENEIGGGPWRAVKSRTRQPVLSTESASTPSDQNESTDVWETRSTTGASSGNHDAEPPGSTDSLEGLD